MIDVADDQATVAASPRREELLDLAYRHVVAHGLFDLSLRPLAGAIGSSPRVLLYLFGSKSGLIRAILLRARHDELAAISSIRAERASSDLATAAIEVWKWLAAPEHRNVLKLWVEVYGLSLVEPGGPWAGFAENTVKDWLDLLASQQPPRRRLSRGGLTERTAVLALLRGAMLDLIATGDSERTTHAVESRMRAIVSNPLARIPELQRDRPKEAGR